MASLLGALVGGAIDRSDGDSGIKGATFGALAPSMLKTSGALLAALLIYRRFAAKPSAERSDIAYY